jgi:hypothetical protein
MIELVRHAASEGDGVLDLLDLAGLDLHAVFRGGHLAADDRERLALGES